MTLHEGLNFCISLTVAMTVSLSVARDLPVCCAPFASTGKARQPVRMECQPYRWNDKVFEGVTFVSGDKRAIVSGFDRQAQVIPVQCGRVALMNGRMLFGMLSLAAQRNAPENPYDPSDVLTIDKQKCQATWSREYDLPGKDKKARFLLTYTGTSDGRLLVDYDFGITPEEAAELTENPLMYASFYLNNAADAWVGFGDKRLVLADGDELIAKGKTARKIPGPKGEGSHIFNYKRDSDGCRWSIEMPAHIMRRVWAWESAGEVKNGQLVRWVQWYCDNFALFAKHNAAQTPVKGRYVIDFCETAVSKESHPAIGGIDFEGQDAVHYPVRPTHNLLMNGSFEQDFKGWQLSDWGDPRYSEAKIPRESLSSDAKFGKTSLLLCGTQKNIRPLHSAPMALEAGRKYVLSWWAKATHAKHAIGHRLVIRSVARSGKFYELKEDAIFKAFPYARVENDGEWHRFERTFEADAFGACVKILADVDAEANHLLIDGIQVALEGSSSEFGEDPYVGNLVSSSPYNDLKPGGEKSLALEIQSYTDKAGKLRVRIKDFYSKYIYDREFELKGDMRLPLGLAAGELGKGLFVVRMDYIVNAKQTWTDYTRFVIQEPLDGTHATAHFFANHPWYNRSSRAPHFMKKFVEWGWKSTQLQFSNNKVGFKDFVAEERRRQGIRNYFNCVALGIHRAYGRKLNEALPPDERLESLKIREWKNVTSNHLAFVEKIAYQMGLEAEPNDDIWTFYGEEEDWVRRPEIGYEAHYQINQAVRRGVSKAFSERGLPPPRMAPSQGPSHYFNGRNYDVIDGYLKAAAVHGYMYDVIAVHPYSNIDGGVQGPKDADIETQHLIAQLKEYGYPETTPIYYTESFNMHPTYIPQWEAAGWADFYRSNTQPSHDMGNYEFLTASGLARINIIGLKFWPRLQMQHTWDGAPILDIRFTPRATLIPVNTLGHLLPSPKFYGDAQPYGDVRGYCFEQGDHAVMAVWTTNHDVEWGKRKGAVLEMDLPADTKFIDICGNECCVENVQLEREDDQRSVKVPLTPAPLFLIAKDAEGLLKGLRESVADDPSTAVSVDVRPDLQGRLNLVLQNETKAVQKGKVKVGEAEYDYHLPSRGKQQVELLSTETEPMKLQSWSSPISLLPNPWELKWFFVPSCPVGGDDPRSDGFWPDWNSIPAQPFTSSLQSPRGSAAYKMAYNKDYLFLRVDVTDSLHESYKVDGRRFSPGALYYHDGCLEVYFDGFGDARQHGTKSYDLNDSRYDFLEENVHRQLAVNWQLAQGTASATDAEIREKLIRRFSKTASGYVYEIAFAARYTAPIDLKPGVVAGIGLTIHQFSPGKDGKFVGAHNTATRPGYNCNYNPYVWPLFILK